MEVIFHSVFFKINLSISQSISQSKSRPCDNSEMFLRRANTTHNWKAFIPLVPAWPLEDGIKSFSLVNLHKQKTPCVCFTVPTSRHDEFPAKPSLLGADIWQQQWHITLRKTSYVLNSSGAKFGSNSGSTTTINTKGLFFFLDFSAFTSKFRHGFAS